MLGQMLMQQRTDLQAPRRALPQERHQAVEGLPRVDDILHQEDVLTPQLGFRIVQQPDIPTRNRIGAIARRHQEVHLERPLDAAHEIAQENEASLEETEIGRDTSELQSPMYLVCRLLLEKKKNKQIMP